MTLLNGTPIACNGALHISAGRGSTYQCRKGAVHISAGGGSTYQCQEGQYISVLRGAEYISTGMSSTVYQFREEGAVHISARNVTVHISDRRGSAYQCREGQYISVTGGAVHISYRRGSAYQ